MAKNNFPIVTSSSVLSAAIANTVLPIPEFSIAEKTGHLLLTEPPCPPTNARNDVVVVYRLVSNNPPKKEDFLTTAIEYPHRPFSPQDYCVAQGVSVFVNENAISKKRERFTNLKSKHIAVGTIFKEDGRVLETCSKFHMTWWLETLTPHRNFKLVTNNATA